MKTTLRLGDCLEWMELMATNSVDSIVTDPPYGLSFMGKKWDHGVPSSEIWAECLRVLKPGGHLLAFGGTRTQHRLVCAIEDAGFDIRDQIAWVYGSGFPKSMNVSKAIDAAAGAEREVVGYHERDNLRKNGAGFRNLPGLDDKDRGRIELTAPSTDAAIQWDGWGTALKPAIEPICLARKPITGTVAANVQQFGTGALNIDGCRVETVDNLNGGAYAEIGGRQESQSLHGATGMNVVGKTVGRQFVQPVGRWPANLIHDGSDEVLAGFPYTTSGAMKKEVGAYGGKSVTGFLRGISGPSNQHGDSGSAARFFYCAKASKSDRGFMNDHPTVKPTDLMRYLCRLVTPPGGTVLDPFMGSGSTGRAAWLEGMDFIGIELDPAYMTIAKRRINELVLDL